MTATTVSQAKWQKPKGKNAMSEQKQFGQLVRVVVQNMPKLKPSQMQRWIRNPKGLQAILAKLGEERFTDNGDGTITFTLPPTDGTTGEEWIARTEKKGNRVGDYAKQLLRSPSFKPTTGVVYKVMVLKGELFSRSDCTTKNTRAEAKKRKLIDLNAEVACLIRENFTDEELKEMGLWWIIVMHEPIKVDGDLGLLGVDRGGGGLWLSGFYVGPGYCWPRDTGFAFAQGPQA